MATASLDRLAHSHPGLSAGASSLPYMAFVAIVAGLPPYPMVNERDVESGKVRATREMFGAD